MTSELKSSVLLVEDHGPLAEELGVFLKDYGFDVTISNNGRQAVRQLSDQVFDFLITDIVMPEMDGLQLLSWMEEQLFEIKVVLTTSVPYESHQADHLKNIILTLEKPFEAEQLGLLIDTLKLHVSKNQVP